MAKMKKSKKKKKLNLYRITVSGTYTKTYMVEAKNKEEAQSEVCDENCIDSDHYEDECEIFLDTKGDYKDDTEYEDEDEW